MGLTGPQARFEMSVSGLTMNIPEGTPAWQVGMAAAIMSKVTVTPGGCWFLGTEGYSSSSHNGRMFLTHRLMCATAHGVKEERVSAVVMHSCDAPPCVNPGHLKFGTYRENTLDMVPKGRSGRSKVTHCPRGHALAGENLSPTHLAKGRRTCRVCFRAKAIVSNGKMRGLAISMQEAVATEIARDDGGRDMVRAAAMGGDASGTGRV